MEKNQLPNVFASPTEIISSEIEEGLRLQVNQMWVAIREFMVMTMIFPTKDKVAKHSFLSLTPIGREGLQPLVIDLCYLHSILPIHRQDPNDLLERSESGISSSYSQASGNEEKNMRTGINLQGFHCRSKKTTSPTTPCFT